MELIHVIYECLKNSPYRLVFCGFKSKKDAEEIIKRLEKKLNKNDEDDSQKFWILDSFYVFNNIEDYNKKYETKL